MLAFCESVESSSAAWGGNVAHCLRRRPSTVTGVWCTWCTCLQVLLVGVAWLVWSVVVLVRLSGFNEASVLQNGGLCFFILDSSVVCPQNQAVLGAKHISNPDFGSNVKGGALL